METKDKKSVWSNFDDVIDSGSTRQHGKVEPIKDDESKIDVIKRTRSGNKYLIAIMQTKELNKAQMKSFFVERMSLIKKHKIQGVEERLNVSGFLGKRDGECRPLTDYLITLNTETNKYKATYSPKNK